MRWGAEGPHRRLSRTRDTATPMNIALIWAMARNRVIGKDNRLPWHLPADLRHFKATTLGAPMIMGRRTFESIGRPLPGRANIVLTSSEPPWQDKVILARTMDEAIEQARKIAQRDNLARCFVAGGSAVYAAALPMADELYITTIDADVVGDTLFPEFSLADFECVNEEAVAQDERHAYGFTMAQYQRTSKAH